MICRIEQMKNRLPKSWPFWLVIAGLILSGLGMALGWDWLRSGATEKEPNSTTVRNAGIVIAGIFALVFALWRGLVAERQAAASQSQAETAERQAETALRQTETAQRQADAAQQGLRNERYQKGAEMLGSEVLAVRLGGIYALQRLAEEHPKQYHVQIVELFCAFVRFPTNDTKIGLHSEVDGEQGDQNLTLRPDVQDTMRFLVSRGQKGIRLERSTRFRPYLRDANVSYLQTADANLSRAWLTNANLSNSILIRADLSNARLRQANLYRANLHGANLSGALLMDANLSHASITDTNLSDATILRANLVSASLSDSNLSRASFRGANLSRSNLAGANLTGADLKCADLTGASFSRNRGVYVSPNPATGLTHEQLDEAFSDPENPPDLAGVLDAETGEQLVWRGKSLKEEGEEL